VEYARDIDKDISNMEPFLKNFWGSVGHIVCKLVTRLIEWTTKRIGRGNGPRKLQRRMRPDSEEIVNFTMFLSSTVS
jgi:hypothetical protein